MIAEHVLEVERLDMVCDQRGEGIVLGIEFLDMRQVEEVQFDQPLLR